VPGRHAVEDERAPASATVRCDALPPISSLPSISNSPAYGLPSAERARPTTRPGVAGDVRACSSTRYSPAAAGTRAGS